MFERTPEILEFGPFRLRPGDGLRRGDQDVPLPPRALAVLEALVARPGLLVSKAELLDAAWKDAFVTEASLLEAVHVLRTALGDDRRSPIYIQTVHRRGYRFVAPVRPQAADAQMAQMESRRCADDADDGPQMTAADAQRVRIAAADAQMAQRAAADDADEADGGPEWRLILRRCAMAAAATVVTGLLVALFGPRPTGVAASVPLAVVEAAQGRILSMEVEGLEGPVSASPDGRAVAFVASGRGGPTLFVRDMAAGRARRIEEHAAPSDPFFAPDGQGIGYFAGGQLKLAVPGSAPRPLAAATPGAGATWTSDGAIVFGGGPGGGLARVRPDDGAPEVLIQPEASSPDVRYGWPDALPRNNGIIFTVVTPAGSDVAVLDPGAAQYRVLAPDAAFGRYSPTGHLVVQRSGGLEAAAFDADRREVVGRFRPVVGDVASPGPLDGPRYAFSQTGALVYVPGAAARPLRVQWHGERNHNLAAQLRVVEDIGAETTPPLLASEAVSPAWQRDGLAVAFAANKAGPYNLFLQPRAGGPDLALGRSPWNQVPTSWSPDGAALAFTEYNPATGADVWILTRNTGLSRPLARTTVDETGARFSPDGRWLAYMARSGSEWQVVVIPVSGGTPALRVPARRLQESLPPRAASLRIVFAWFTALSQRMREPA